MIRFGGSSGCDGTVSVSSAAQAHSASGQYQNTKALLVLSAVGKPPVVLHYSRNHSCQKQGMLGEPTYF
jgi:hypothetical protein